MTRQKVWNSNASLTDARQLLAAQHIYAPGAADKTGHVHPHISLIGNMPNDRCFATQWFLAQKIKSRLGISLRDKGDKTPFIGNMNGVEAQQVAGGAYICVHGN